MVCGYCAFGRCSECTGSLRALGGPCDCWLRQHRSQPPREAPRLIRDALELAERFVEEANVTEAMEPPAQQIPADEERS